MFDEQVGIFDFLKKIFLFHELDDWKLSRLASEFDVVRLAAGEKLYTEGEPADNFYILLSGNILLSTAQGKKRQQYGKLIPGDFLGEDLLIGNSRRELAVSANDTIIIRLQKEKFLILLEEFPDIRTIALTTARTRQSTRKNQYKWLGEDEAVYFIVRKHEIFLFLKLLLPIVFMIAFVLLFGWSIGTSNTTFVGISVIGVAVSLIIGIWVWLDWGNDFYVVTSRRVLSVEKVILLFDSRQEAPLSTILSTNVHTYPSLRQFFDYGTVVVNTYTGAIQMRRIRTPGLMVAYINGLQTRMRELKKQDENETMEVVIRQRLGLFDEKPAQPKTAAAITSTREKKPVAFGKLFTDFLKIRYEEEDKITYRKHWFVLFKKIWLQSLVIAGLIIVLYYFFQSSLMNIYTSGMWGAVFFIVFSFWIYQYIDWRNDIYIVTLEHIFDIERKPLGREDKKSASLENILSLEQSRVGIFGLMFNYGTVTINVGTEKFLFYNVYNPAQVQYDLFNRMSNLRQRKEQIEAAKERERIADWIAIYHKQAGFTGEIEDPPRNDRISE